MAVEVCANRECDQIISAYAQYVSDSGAIPMLIPSIEKADNIEALLNMADGVVLIGGKDYNPKFYYEEPHPETNLERLRPEFDIMFGKAVLKKQLPVLGICAGCQLLNVVSGGKLIQHLPNAEEAHRDGKTHSAKIIKDGFFARAIGRKAGDEISVNSFHHQALNPDYIGEGFIISATAFDGSVEAIELLSERMVLGVQFHPERMNNFGLQFFTLLKQEAEKFKLSKE
jgi:putative glutamine amidotransferase